MSLDRNIKKYFLKPAEFYFVEQPATIRTVLGSCVSLTMYCRRTRTGAVCHPVLPLCRESGSCQSNSCQKKYKYVECVVPEMIKRFQMIGVDPKELEIKLFGGAHMFHKDSKNKRIQHVGSMNVSMARLMIDELEVNLQNFDVGGTHGRKIIFDTETGDIWLKKLKKDSPDFSEQQVLKKQIQMQLNG